MKIRWGVIGCGGIARTKGIPGMILAENAELVAVQDRKADVAEAVRAESGAKYAFSEAILQDTKPPVPAEEGLAAQQVVEATYRSQATGTRVKVEK